MMVLGLNGDGDLDLSAGDLVWLTGAPAVRQKVASRFKFFLGEWFLDQRQGVPYYRHIFVKNPVLAVIRLVFRRVLLRTPGIISVPTFDLEFDRATRKLFFRFEAMSEANEPIVVQPNDRAFIVEV
jgi:hypothetical protein